MIDSHCHVDQCDGEPADVVAAARTAGVQRMLTVGIDAASCVSALALAEQFPEIYAAIGHHPNAATGYSDGDTERLRELAASDLCRAIGETGVDLYREGASLTDQTAAFESQAEIAREFSKPLVIHSRAAEQETLDLLARFAEGLEVIIHCFSMPDRLDECLERGYWISYAGNVTYPKAEDLAASVALVPLDRLLVETDSPYLSPQANRGKRNEPKWVTETALFVAEQRGISYGELEAAVESNAAALFGW